MSEDEQYELLATDGMLVKAPAPCRRGFCDSGIQGKRMGRKKSGKGSVKDNCGNKLTEHDVKKIQEEIEYRKLVVRKRGDRSGQKRQGHTAT